MDESESEGSAKEAELERYFRVRREEAARHVDAWSRYREFFFQLDYNSLPTWAPHIRDLSRRAAEARHADVVALLTLLGERLEARVHGHRRRRLNLPAEGELPRGERGAVARISNLLEGLLRQCFSRDGVVDWLDVERAFERFANRDLRMVWTDETLHGGEPDGANFFFYAEFAFLAIELGIDADVWSRLVNVFVRSIEIFLSTYRPRGSADLTTPVWSKFDARHFDPHARFDEDGFRELARRYAGRDLFELEQAFGHLGFCAKYLGVVEKVDERTTGLVGSW